MTKKLYTTPKLETEQLNTKDIITASPFDHSDNSVVYQHGTSVFNWH